MVDSSNLVNVNGNLFFSANDGVNGVELWKSDGTVAGTLMIKDLYPGNDGSAPTDFININGTTYFSALDYNGRELWKTDGTPAGTIMVKNTGSFDSVDPQYLTNLNGTLFSVGWPQQVPGHRSTCMFVPALVPSLPHNSSPLATVSAAK